MPPHATSMECCPMPPQPHATPMPCCPNAMPPHAAPMPCLSNAMPPHAAPCHPMPSKFHAATSPSAHPSILYHNLPLILVINPIHCPLAHPYTVCNQYSINPSPYIIHPWPIHLHWVQLTPRPTYLQWLQYTPWAHVGWPRLVREIVPSAGPSNMDLIH